MKIASPITLSLLVLILFATATATTKPRPRPRESHGRKAQKRPSHLFNSGDGDLSARIRRLEPEPLEPFPMETEPPIVISPVPENVAGGSPRPTNDMCPEAQMLSPGEATRGTNAFSTWEFMQACGDFLGGNVTGVWYMVQGTGSGLGAVLNATYDMQMAVYEGSCESLICIGGTAGSYAPWTYGEIKGNSDPDEVYYILVTGWEGATGEFVLHIVEEDPPENSDIEAAILLTLGESFTGFTEYASIPDEGQFPPCTVDEVFHGITAPTVWFTFVPNATVIVQFSLYADYDAQISIYEGESPETLTCWNSNDDSPIPGPRSVIAQPLEQGKTYYINVHGYQKAYGMFTLESEELQAPTNDLCSGATSLELGVEAESNSLAATGDAGLPFCGV